MGSISAQFRRIILQQILPELEITASSLLRPREDDFSDCIECWKSAEQESDDAAAWASAALIRVQTSFEWPDKLGRTIGKGSGRRLVHD